MAEVLDDGEFWLPSQFLTDDDFFVDGVKATNNIKNLNGECLLPYEFPGGFGSFGFSSDLSSPVESVLGSAETESDEEDYLAGLSRQMAHSTLEDDSRRIDASENPKGWVLPSSPQSTLCALPSGCGCKEGSSRGSPNCQSRVSSPPATWDLLYAAAGEVERLRMNEETYGGFSNRGLLGPPARNPSAYLDASGLHPQQSFSHNKLRATHFQQLKQQQLMIERNALVWEGLKQQQQNHVVQNRGRYGVGALGLSPSTCPPLKQQQQQPPNGSGVRAVFLGNPNGKKQCAGTGVFLPRRIGNSSEPRKKLACPTVFVPARVAQALNLNLDEVIVHPRSISSFSSVSSDAAALRLQNGGNVVGNQRQRNLRPQQEISHEVRLPQEWTY